ncbi:hypothetical protein OUZ56_022579 [Daphnia magna]|uniref:Uncharacterized protein n=1 Tax=Daphnia magna TaxID=35525 RepID=A0ABR0AWW2_9CRUS|nr:hypothetical protein OUZ56_022579 [Daphnia magna]
MVIDWDTYRLLLETVRTCSSFEGKAYDREYITLDIEVDVSLNYEIFQLCFSIDVSSSDKEPVRNCLSRNKMHDKPLFHPPIDKKNRYKQRPTLNIYDVGKLDLSYRPDLRAPPFNLSYPKRGGAAEL